MTTDVFCVQFFESLIEFAFGMLSPLSFSILQRALIAGFLFAHLVKFCLRAADCSISSLIVATGCMPEINRFDNLWNKLPRGLHLDVSSGDCLAVFILVFLCVLVFDFPTDLIAVGFDSVYIILQLCVQ